MKTSICVFSSDEDITLNLWTQYQRILVKNEVERAASSCRKRRRQRGEGGALPWKLPGAECALIYSILLLLPVTLIFFNLFYQM